MPAVQVNPTRMELTNTKRRLKTAVRGHKLMRDKRDEMVRRFMEVIRKNQQLRQQVEGALTVALKDFAMARAQMSAEALENAVPYPVNLNGAAFQTMFQKECESLWAGAIDPAEFAKRVDEQGAEILSK